MSLYNNILTDADVYKFSHWEFEPEGITETYSYIEAREGGVYPTVLFYGLQPILRRLERVVRKGHVKRACKLLRRIGIEPNEAGFNALVEKHGGKLPLIIRALPEGLVVPLGTPLVTVENTDDEFSWLTSFVETLLLRVWYPTSVATRSMYLHSLIRAALVKSGTPELSRGRLVDFGSRGVSSPEEAQIGGSAHLVVFDSTDNVQGVVHAIEEYGAKDDVGSSIRATEHSVTCSAGRENELQFYRNIIKKHGKPGRYVSVVLDTYDLDAALDMWCIDLKDELLASGMTLVGRPDSGTPSEMVLRVVERLGRGYGYTVNEKGYRVLHPSVRVIQGDGITDESLKEILDVLLVAGWSADNVVFGSGGHLLRAMTRDTERFAMKASNVVVDGVSFGISKTPKTDMSKASKSGKFAVVAEEGEIITLPLEGNEWRNLLRPVYRNGVMVKKWTFDEVRARARR